MAITAERGVCCHCQSVAPVRRNARGALVMVAHTVSGGSGVFCDGQGTVPQTLVGEGSGAGKAQCGCVYHAEDGIPCEHDRELAERTGAQ
jgi:hypothetical protein